MTPSSVGSSTPIGPRDFAEPVAAEASVTEVSCCSCSSITVPDHRPLSCGASFGKRVTAALPALVAAAAAAYFGMVYFPAVATYYTISDEARALVRSSPANPHAAVSSFVARIQGRSDVSVDPGSVRLKSKGGKIRQLRLSLRVPIRFPGLRAGRALTFGINHVADPKQE